jgi:hypothetical protein
LKRKSIVLLLIASLIFINLRAGLCRELIPRTQARATEKQSTLVGRFAQQPASQPAKPGPDGLKIRGKVRQMGVGHEITVILKDGREYHGSVSRIDDTRFEMAEVDLKQPLAIAYDEVRKVRGSYGGKNIYGKRTNRKTGFIIMAALVGTLLTLAVIGAKD